MPPKSSSNRIERRLTTLFPSTALEDHAEAVGVVERDSKFQVPAMVWALVFGFAAGESRTLAAFRRSYNATADKTLSPGGFYQRLTPLFAAYLRDLVEFALDEVAVPHTVSDEFDRFRDVMIADATVLRLHRFLREEYRGLREEQAGAKLHLLHNVTDRTIEKISITGERPHDSTEFKTGSWLHGRLLILDLAYFKYRRFARIDENGGYFVSRLKTNTKPEIVAELREWRGRAIPLEGEQVFEIAEDLHRKYVDVEVEVRFRRGPYAGTRSWDTKRFRVVGGRHEGPPPDQLYNTKQPPKGRLPAGKVKIYRCRWAVELLFRELKTLYELDEFDTTNPAVVEILLYAAILTLVVSRELLELVIEHADDDAVFPPERWVATIRSHAQRILKRLSNYLDYSPPPLLERMAADAQKIHQERPILQERLATVTQPTAGVS